MLIAAKPKIDSILIFNKYYGGKTINPTYFFKNFLLLR